MKQCILQASFAALLVACVPWEPPNAQYGIQSAAWLAIGTIPFDSLCAGPTVTCDSLYVDRNVVAPERGHLPNGKPGPVDFVLTDESGGAVLPLRAHVVANLKWGDDSSRSLRMFVGHFVPYGSGDTATFCAVIWLPNGNPFIADVRCAQLIRRERNWVVRRVDHPSDYE